MTLDAAKLAAYNLTVADLMQSLQAANTVRQVGERVGDDRAVPVTAGRFLASAGEVSELVVGLRQGRPLHLSDVAHVRAGADPGSQG